MMSVVSPLNVERFWHGAEPDLEARWADSRVVAGGERSIVQRNAEVAYLGICDDLTWRLGGGQESSDEFVERYPIRTGYFDRAIHRRPNCDIGHGGGQVIGPDGLRKNGGQMHRLPNGARLDDGAPEFIELYGLDDRMGNR